MEKRTMYYVIFCCIFYVFISTASTEDIPSCASLVYCQGPLLDTVQKAQLFPDSKTFVDMKMKNDVATTLRNFEKMMVETDNKPAKDDVRQFVTENFEPGDELEEWKAKDFDPNPPFLREITDDALKQFAKDIIGIWPQLARKIKPEVFQEIQKYSIIPVTHGFIVPGGRFREFYYWDSYWIQKGLLLSGMKDTVRGMLNNFLSMVEQYGFIPNGGRVYYLNRSQPPLLTLMISEYIKHTGDLKWLEKNIELIDRELVYWMTNKTVEFEYKNRKYALAHYDSESGSPRPESYIEDIKTCQSHVCETRIKQCYKDLKSGAETGWDFSSRWIFDKNGEFYANLSQIRTRRVIPVDLNAFLAQAFKIQSEFYRLLGNSKMSDFWLSHHLIWKTFLHEVLYDEDEGIWFDLDLELKRHRKGFYPSSFAPLWSNIYGAEKSFAKKAGLRAAAYLENMGIMEFIGGVPTSLYHSGEQWDLPNAWPPLQSIVILGLERSGSVHAKQIAQQLANRWLMNNMDVYGKTGMMFEKYNAEAPGVVGGGGEYTVQSGFGWTNGVVLELINEYYTNQK